MPVAHLTWARGGVRESLVIYQQLLWADRNAHCSSLNAPRGCAWILRARNRTSLALAYWYRRRTGIYAHEILFMTRMSSAGVFKICTEEIWGNEHEPRELSSSTFSLERAHGKLNRFTPQVWGVWFVVIRESCHTSCVHVKSHCWKLIETVHLSCV